MKGTVNVLRSCKKASSIKRVVVTSSMASVMFNYNPVNSEVIVDETWFSDTLFCEEKKVRMIPSSESSWRKLAFIFLNELRSGITCFVHLLFYV